MRLIGTKWFIMRHCDWKGQMRLHEIPTMHNELQQTVSVNVPALASIVCFKVF